MNQKINEKLTEQDVKDIFKEAQIYADIYTFAVDYCSFFIIDLSNSYFGTSADVIGLNLDDYCEVGQVQDSVFIDCTSKQAKDLKSFYLKWNKKHLQNLTSFTKSELQELASDIHDLIIRYNYYNNDRFDFELDLGVESFPEQAKQAYQQQLDKLEELKYSDTEGVIDYLLAADYELDSLVDNDCLLEIARNKDDINDVFNLLEDYEPGLNYHYINECGYGYVNDDEIDDYLYEFVDDKKDRLKDLIKLADKTIHKEN